jgi:hypothetical protein
LKTQFITCPNTMMNKVNILKKGQKKPNNAKTPQKGTAKVVRRVDKVASVNKSVRGKFTEALCDPFSPHAIGCHVPDPFPFPTTTYHVHQTTTLKSPASLTGSGGVMFLPNVVYSMVDCNYAGTLTANQSVIGTTPMAQLSATNPFNYGAVTQSDVFSKFGTFRVVSWGIKISNLQPELSATGRIIVAHLPVGDAVPSYNTLTNVIAATQASWLTPITGIRPDIMSSSSLIEMPDAVEFAVQDLLHGDVEINGRYTNTAFWNFKSASAVDNITATFVEGDEAYTNASTGFVQSNGLKDLTRCNGGAAIVVYFEGMPVTSGNVNLQIETIYHIEGSPTLGGTTNSALISASSGATEVGTTFDVERSMIRASMPEVAFKFLTKGAQFLNNNQKVIRSIASALI